MKDLNPHPVCYEKAKAGDVVMEADGQLEINGRRHLPANFISGSIAHDDRTDRYSEEVHARVWMLVKAMRQRINEL